MKISEQKLSAIVENLNKTALIEPIENVEPFAEGNANDIFLLNKKYVLKIAKENPKGIEVNDINTESAILDSLKNELEFIPKLIYRNTELNCYLSDLIPGEILKLFLPKMNEAEKQKLGKQLGSFLFEFHSKKINVSLQIRPDKNYHTKRLHQKEVIDRLKNKSAEIAGLITEVSEIIEDSLTNKNLVLTHSDFHWKNILIDPASYEFKGLVDFGNVCLDYPEVDFRQMMGRYDFELGQAMVLEYEKLQGRKLNRELLFAHCALNNLWHYYGKENKDPNPWYDKWANQKNYFLNF